MIAMDMPDVPPQYAQVMIVQTSQAQGSAGKIDRSIGVCSLVQNPVRETAFNAVGPIGTALIYLHNRGELLDVGSGAATVLSHPRHGALEPSPYGPGGYLYVPKPDYFGPDRATFLVEVGGKKVRLEYFFEVLHGVADGLYENKEFCPKGGMWKISLNPDDPDGSLIAFQDPFQLTGDLAGVPRASLSFEDLPGTALGETRPQPPCAESPLGRSVMTHFCRTPL